MKTLTSRILSLFGIALLAAAMVFFFAACEPEPDPDKSESGIEIPKDLPDTEKGDGDDSNIYGDFEYIIEDFTITITQYNGDGGNVIIPDTINGMPVTKIGSEVFLYKRDIYSVTIGNNITHIGSHAFTGNRLTNVIIPNSVTSIGNGAFAANQLTSVDIPNSVTSIGSGAFAGNKLTSVDIPNSVISIDELAFAENKLTSVDIPNSITYIYRKTFLFNELTSVIIPNSVISIEYDAFGGNKLTSVTIGENINIPTRAFDNRDGSANGFETAYNNEGKAAGTYTRPNIITTTWTKVK